MRKRIKYIFFIRIILITLFEVSGGFYLYGIPFNKPTVKDGYIDISKWNFQNDGAIELSGTWKFVWLKDNEIYKSSDYNDRQWSTLNVPGYWNNKTGTSAGYCWLRLKIKNNINANLGIYIESSYTAYNLYVNDKLYLKNGNPGNNNAEHTGQNVPVFTKLPNTEYLSLAWKISNFDDINGGPLFTPVINTVNVLEHNIWIADLQNSFILGIIFMISIYNFIIWLGRREDLSSLYLSIFCFTIFIRLFTINCIFEKIFIYNYIFDLRKKLEYSGITIGCFSIISYYNKLFPEENNKIIVKTVQIIGIIISIFFLLTSSMIFTSFLVGCQIYIILTVVYILIVIILAVKHKRKGGVLILIGSIYLALTIVNDILNANKIINTTNFISWGLVLFILMQTITSSRRLAKAYKTAEYLSSNLKIEVKKQTFELEEATRQKTDFFINLAHETKTPLSLIGNYLEKYIKEHEKNKDLLIIKQNIEKLKNDMVNFLDIEKLKGNQIFYDHDQICNLSQLIYDKNILFKETASQKNINLQWNMEEEIYVKADPAAIDRVLNNLLDNAVKYTEGGGHVFISLCRETDTIKLSVSDTGIGISEQQKNYIFAPHYQISHKKQNIQGLGMGLYITDMIIKQLEGCIFLESEIGKGAKFTITMKEYELKSGDEVITDFKPTIPPEIIVIDREDLKVNDFDKDKKTIFIAEDNLQLVANLKNELEHEYNVYFGVNGADALDKLKSSPVPDIIISDIMMDVMDGYTFRKELIKKENYKAIPFIFLTARGGSSEKIRGLSQGAVDYICKPFETRELIEKIKSWLLLIELRNFRDNIDLKTKHQSRLESFIKEFNITRTEKEVILYLLKKNTNHEIAEKMFISENTVKKHIERIKEKIAVVKKQELLQYLFEYVYK